MKEKIRFMLSVIGVVSLIFILSILIVYICRHPEKRGISYYENDDYYICRVDLTTRGVPNRYGVINKSDYKKWERGNNGTIWLVDAKHKDRGWRFNCRNIISIAIYDKNGYVPLLLN